MDSRRERQRDAVRHIIAAKMLEEERTLLGQTLAKRRALDAMLEQFIGDDPESYDRVSASWRKMLVAHVVEEQTRQKPMRKIDPVNHTYDGPER